MISESDFLEIVSKVTDDRVYFKRMTELNGDVYKFSILFDNQVISCDDWKVDVSDDWVDDKLKLEIKVKAGEKESPKNRSQRRRGGLLYLWWDDYGSGESFEHYTSFIIDVIDECDEETLLKLVNKNADILNYITNKSDKIMKVTLDEPYSMMYLDEITASQIEIMDIDGLGNYYETNNGICKDDYKLITKHINHNEDVGLAISDRIIKLNDDEIIDQFLEVHKDAIWIDKIKKIIDLGKL